MWAEPFDKLRTAPFDKLRTAPVEAPSAPFDKLRTAPVEAPSAPFDMLRAQAAAGDHLLLLDRDGLGEVAGLVDVVAFLGSKLAGEDLQRHDGHQRL